MKERETREGGEKVGGSDICFDRGGPPLSSARKRVRERFPIKEFSVLPLL